MEVMVAEEATQPHGELLDPKASIIIADAGAQLVDVIYWQLVEDGFRSEIIPFTRKDGPLDIAAIKSQARAVLYTGSGESVNNKGAPQVPPELLDIPSFGICYGAQAIAKALGGQVGPFEKDGQRIGEYGRTSITVDPDAVIYSGLTKVITEMSHGDSILQLAEGHRATGWSGDIIASYESEDGLIIGTQFHPEVGDTEGGADMLRRFLAHANIQPDPDFTFEVALTEYMDKEEAKIAEKLENGDLIYGFLSGGIDSVVAASAVLKVATELNRLEQIKFYYVDTGHMRVEDEDIVRKMQELGLPVEYIDAKHMFFHTRVMLVQDGGEPFLSNELVDEADPEIKRAIIGEIFYQFSLRMMEEVEATTERKVYWMQGTNNSDLIESGGRGGKKIKGHHNIEAMQGLRDKDLLVEPLIHLMKYHVRWLGEHRYHLPEEFYTRQPFPGVGFSPRIVVNLSGELAPLEPDRQEKVDSFVYEMAGDSIKAHVIPINTVGVMGDDRSLDQVVVLDGEADWGLLYELARRLPQEMKGVNRVFYAPGTRINRAAIKGAITRDDEQNAAALKRMEEIHRQAMLDSGLDRYLTQHFVATLGMDLVGANKPTLALRLFISGRDLDKTIKRRTGASRETLRTGVIGMPGVNIDEAQFSQVIAALQAGLQEHGSLIYDLTGKPPGTVEYE